MREARSQMTPSDPFFLDNQAHVESLPLECGLGLAAHI